MKPSMVFSACLGLCGLSGTLVALAQTHEPPRLKPKSTTPMTFPAPKIIHVPVDGVTDPGKTSVSAIVTEHSDLPPTAPIEQAALPALHSQGQGKAKGKAKLPKGGAITPGFQCTSAEKTECYFTKMPFYNQINPNLAYVSVPEATYENEGKPVTGPMEWDAKAGHWAVIMNPGTKTQKLNPFYASWLPLGPDPKDADTLGIFHTELCGPTSESMALMAAWEARSPTTKVRPGSWVEESFLKATKPAWQEALPSPLKTDHCTLAPDHVAMTAEEIQRVINMAILQKTNPIGGGSDGEFVSMALDNDFISDKPSAGHRVIDIKQGSHPSTADLVEVVRDRFAPVFVWGRYVGTLTSNKDAHGKVTSWSLTFQRIGGHFMAINGFKNGGTPNASLLIFDPVFARPTWMSFTTMPVQGLKAKDGTPLNIFFKTKNGAAPVSGANLSILQDLKVNPTSFTEVTDQQHIHIVDGYRAIRIN